MGSFLYFLVVQCSLFALGATLVACAVLIIRRPSRWWAYVGTKTSMAGLVGIILIKVLPARTVDLNGYSVAYIIFLLGLAACVSFVASDVVHRTARPPGLG